VQDLIYVAGIVALFLLTVLFVVGCDKIIGPDEDALAEDEPQSSTTSEQTKVAA
jgi:hypothetical protein